MNGKSTFDVVDKTESFVSFFDGDDIHVTGWEGNVTSNFTVNFDQVVHGGLKHPQANRQMSKIILYDPSPNPTLFPISITQTRRTIVLKMRNVS